MSQYRWGEGEANFKSDSGEEPELDDLLTIPYGGFREEDYLAIIEGGLQKEDLYSLLDSIESPHWSEGLSPIDKEKALSIFKKFLYSYGIKQIREKRLHRDIESNRCPSPTLTVRKINDRIPRPKVKFSCPEAYIIKNNILKILKEGDKKYSAPEIINRVCNKNKNKYSPHLVGYVLWKMTEGRLLDSVEER